MCGIAGQWALDQQIPDAEKTRKAIAGMRSRGPDAQKELTSGMASFGHARLSILDLSEAAHQPFQDPDGRFTLVFNGEIFNFLSLRKELENKGINFETRSDTEVLLHLFMLEGPSMLNRLNGFFAFAVYDKLKNEIFLARDRFGVKPLFYTIYNNTLMFASELKGLMAMRTTPELDPVSLTLYFRTGYIPGPFTVYQDVFQLMPGHFLASHSGKLKNPVAWYQWPDHHNPRSPLPNYSDACKNVHDLVCDAVKLRLISDVPLGAFLSGGVDSSVVVAAAVKHNPQLHTFSIGYADEPFFDETRYAEAVARHFGTEHTTFSLTNNDLLSEVDQVLDYMDQPFADSSALPVHILSRKTREHVTVSLSGDGGDELFSGYNKHMAEFLMRQGGIKTNILRMLAPAAQWLPASRQSAIGNKIRQLRKFARVHALHPAERYRQLAGVTPDDWAEQLLQQPETAKAAERIGAFTAGIRPQGSMNEVLETDMKLVLPFDMLTKVDLMSMANSLEVRTPLLDYRLVNYVSVLPENYKIDRRRKKKLLIDAFKEEIPEIVYNRPKHGFEVPLLGWFRKELNTRIRQTFNDEGLFPPHIFRREALQEAIREMESPNPGEAAFKVWSLLVWASWFKKIQ